MTRKEYIQRYAGYAIHSCKGTGLFPSVMLAQALVETNNGNSYLATVANNHFGVKCHSDWKGPSVKATDDKPNECFRKYSSVLDSYKDRNKFLKENPRYTKAGVFTAETPEEQVRALQAAGYATGAGYANLIISIIKSNRLDVFDEGIQTAGFFSGFDWKLFPERIIISTVLILIIYTIIKLSKSRK